ncbi:MAG: response regulator transcription factor [Erysipelotrichaceae bacterium]
MYKLLLIEDDSLLNKALTIDLIKEGYIVESIYLGYDALNIDISEFSMVILDVNLPDISGFELIKILKVKKQDISVVFLSACDLDDDILKGYDLGAEDYITKPFNTSILHHRINRVLNRKANVNKQLLVLDERLRYNLLSGVLFVDNERISLTPIEKRMFEYFINNSDQVLPRENIINYLWDFNNNYVDEHTLTVNITRLRNKIETKSRKYIKTVYGIGYLWSCDKYEKN